MSYYMGKALELYYYYKFKSIQNMLIYATMRKYDTPTWEFIEGY